jgi:hypothetical protein
MPYANIPARPSYDQTAPDSGPAPVYDHVNGPQVPTYGADTNTGNSPIGPDARKVGYAPARTFKLGNSVDDKVDQFWKDAQATSDSLRGVNTDNPNVQADSDRRYREADASIQSQFYQQADSTAAYLARQGLGSSGINVAASNALSNNKSALEGQAKLKATDLAIEKERQRILDAFSTKAMGLQPELQNKGINVSQTIAQMQLDAQLKMFQEQMDAQNASGWGQLAGSIVPTATAGALLLCDRRLKRHIRKLDAEWLPGVPLYEFEYEGIPGKHTGPMAQEVEKIYPNLVVSHPGIKGVRL